MRPFLPVKRTPWIISDCLSCRLRCWISRNYVDPRDLDDRPPEAAGSADDVFLHTDLELTVVLPKDRSCGVLVSGYLTCRETGGSARIWQSGKPERIKSATKIALFKSPNTIYAKFRLQKQHLKVRLDCLVPTPQAKSETDST